MFFPKFPSFCINESEEIKFQISISRSSSVFDLREEYKKSPFHLRSPGGSYLGRGLRKKRCKKGGRGFSVINRNFRARKLSDRQKSEYKQSYIVGQGLVRLKVDAHCFLLFELAGMLAEFRQFMRISACPLCGFLLTDGLLLGTFWIFELGP